jgi:hypothetical protein
MIGFEKMLKTNRRDNSISYQYITGKIPPEQALVSGVLAAFGTAPFVGPSFSLGSVFWETVSTLAPQKR